MRRGREVTVIRDDEGKIVVVSLGADFCAEHEWGIKKLKEANCRYFACSPKWSHEIKSTADGEIKTKYPVIFWLNPMEQDRNSYGWFTVENLELWTQGKGPIVELKRR